MLQILVLMDYLFQNYKVKNVYSEISILLYLSTQLLYLKATNITNSLCVLQEIHN